MFLAHLNWQDAEVAFKTKDLVTVIPLGSTEQHGPLGPLGTDFIIPDHMAAEIEKQSEVLVVPTMPYGVSPHHTGFPGTIDIGAEALYLVMKGLTSNLMRSGAKKFLFLNGHGGNDPSLDKVGLEVFRAGGLCSQINWWSLAPALNPKWITGHGDAQEVAMMRSIHPELIKDERLIPTTINHVSDSLTNTYINQVSFGKAGVKVIRDVRTTVSSGAFGGLDSSLGSKEWGDEMKKAVVDYCVAFINEFRKVDLPKVHANA